MATDQRNLPAHLSGDADFRTWAQGIAAQLAAVGLVKTGDTGQVDLTTAARPLANAFAGYEVYRFNDTLQATAPVFIKVEYGVGGTVTRPSLAMTVGTATNGAGVLGGQLGARFVAAPNAEKVAGEQLPSYCSGGPGRVALFTRVDPVSFTFSMGMIVERVRGADGVQVGDGVYTLLTYPYTFQYQAIPSSGIMSPVETYAPALALDKGSLAARGSDIAFSAHVAFLGKALYALPLTYRKVDVPQLATFQVTHLGALRTYLPLGEALYSYGTTQVAIPAYSLAMPWE